MIIEYLSSAFIHSQSTYLFTDDHQCPVEKVKVKVQEREIPEQLIIEGSRALKK